MAQYTVTYRANNEVHHEIEFMGEKFDYTMMPVPGGAQSDKKAFEYQITERFPDIDENMIELVEMMTYGEDEAQEALEALTEYENRSR